MRIVGKVWVTLTELNKDSSDFIILLMYYIIALGFDFSVPFINSISVFIILY